MTNPLIAQGTLNRIRGSAVFAAFPQLNVTAPFLGKEGISLALEGQTTEYHETMTGAVTAPNVYLMTNVVLRLLKSQNLAAIYKAQWELDSRVGDMIITPDAATLPQFQIVNASISAVGDMAFGGSTAEMMVTIRGYYYVNSILFQLN